MGKSVFRAFLGVWLAIYTGSGEPVSGALSQDHRRWNVDMSEKELRQDPSRELKLEPVRVPSLGGASGLPDRQESKPLGREVNAGTLGNEVEIALKSWKLSKDRARLIVDLQVTSKTTKPIGKLTFSGLVEHRNQGPSTRTSVTTTFDKLPVEVALLPGGVDIVRLTPFAGGEGEIGFEFTLTGVEIDERLTDPKYLEERKRIRKMLENVVEKE